MTKSIHIIGSRRLGGAESFYMRLVKALHEQEPTTAVNRSDSLVARELEGVVPQTHVSMSSQWDIFSRRKISQLIKREQPDIVQTYMTRATVLTHVKPRQGTVHVARLGGFYKIKRFAHAHAWVGNTHGICDYLIKGGLPADKVFYIGNFVDRPAAPDQQQQQQLHQQLGLPDDALVIVSLGRMVQKKGFQDLLAAFARLDACINNRPVHLVVVGDGPMRNELEQQAQSLRLSKRVHWAGWQTQTSPYYFLADLFVCPSRHEPLGNVILEAWSHRLPVLSTASHGAIELIEDGVNGVLTPCEDAPALADKMRTLLSANEADRQKLAQQGYASIEADYHPEAVLQAYQELYQQLCKR